MTWLNWFCFVAGYALAAWMASGFCLALMRDRRTWHDEALKLQVRISDAVEKAGPDSTWLASLMGWKE